MTVNYSVIVSCSAHFSPGGRNSGSTTDRVIADSRYSEARLYFEGIEMTSDHCASVLHKVKTWLLEAAEQDKNKTHNENNGDIRHNQVLFKINNKINQ